MKIEDQKSGEYRFSSTYQFFIDYIDCQCSLRMADVSPHSSPLMDVSRGGTSATQRQKSILMTQNLSGIQSEVLIGRRSSFIVLAIVYR